MAETAVSAETPGPPLEGSVRGAVLRSGDAGYDDARAVWNGMVDRHPAVITRCAGTADIIAAVGFARQHGLALSVKGGGHNVAGRAVCDGGLMLDLSGMQAVRVDPVARTARVEPGTTWGVFDHEAQAFGLATTGGLDSRTGVAGLTLGGGIGYLARKHGLAADNLIGADVVTADGDLVHVSDDDHADLFWALRGGGGGFGIVTSFEFRLHEVGPEVLVGQAYHLFRDAAEVLGFYRDLAAGAPDELSCYALVLRVPPVDPFPAEHHGSMVVAILACYVGALEEGRAALEPLDRFGQPILKVIAPAPYVVQQRSFDTATPDGGRYYYKSTYFRELSDVAIQVMVDHLEPLPGPLSIVALEPMGGAINRVAPTATAFPHRDVAVGLGAWGGWQDPGDQDEVVAWARQLDEAMRPFGTGTYLNYLDRSDDDRARAAFGANYERLLEVKSAWDPDDLFGANHLIRSTG